jgi:predicted TIM-barrel enzyme
VTRVAARGIALAIALPLVSLAAPPEACTIVSIPEINQIAAGTIEKTQVRKAGNPSECSFVDGRRAAVLVISLREVQYAAENELQYERENLEKIYRSRAKWITPTIGDNAFWIPANKQLVFRKGKIIGSVLFSRVANQNEVDSAQVARLVEANLGAPPTEAPTK